MDGARCLDAAAANSNYYCFAGASRKAPPPPPPPIINKAVKSAADVGDERRSAGRARRAAREWATCRRPG